MGEEVEDDTTSSSSSVSDTDKLIDRSPYGEDVWFFLTSNKMDSSAGKEKYDRNNIKELRVNLDSELVLSDNDYLMVINFGITPISFTVSGPKEPPPPTPEPVVIIEEVTEEEIEIIDDVPDNTDNVD